MSTWELMDASIEIVTVIMRWLTSVMVVFRDGAVLKEPTLCYKLGEWTCPCHGMDYCRYLSDSNLSYIIWTFKNTFELCCKSNFIHLSSMLTIWL